MTATKGKALRPTKKSWRKSKDMILREALLTLNMALEMCIPRQTGFLVACQIRPNLKDKAGDFLYFS